MQVNDAAFAAAHRLVSRSLANNPLSLLKQGLIWTDRKEFFGVEKNNRDFTAGDYLWIWFGFLLAQETKPSSAATDS